ncbi:MAG: hypothetical protein FWD59_08865 [Micrococcales bacterium]|nr:hypothetical protein [Micrococcales bacterium]
MTAITLAETSSESDAKGLGLVLLALGPIVYAVIYFAYRNPEARHHYERETEVRIDGVTANDVFVQRHHRSRQSEIPGENSTQLKGITKSGPMGFVQQKAATIHVPGVPRPPR